MGDFNSVPTDNAIQFLTGDYLIKNKQSKLVDIWDKRE